MSKDFSVTVLVSLSMRCDHCGKRKKVTVTITGSNIWDTQKIIRDAKYEARYGPDLKGWVWRSFGAKGTKHYCPKCADDPEMKRWAMERVLQGKPVNEV